MSTAGWHEHSHKVVEESMSPRLLSRNRPLPRQKRSIAGTTSILVSQESIWHEREKQFCAACRVTGKGTENSAPDSKTTCIPTSHTRTPKPPLHHAMQMESGINPADPTNSPNNPTSSKCVLQVGKSLMHHEVVTLCCFLIPSFLFVWEFTAMRFLQKPSNLPAPISC